MPEDNGGGSTRGLLHGYIREHLFMTAREHADLVAGFVIFAEREGYRLGKVFTEKVETAPEAFGALVQAVQQDKAAAVAVPSLHHLGVLGYPTALRDDLERSTGVQVVVTGQAHIPRGGRAGAPQPAPASRTTPGRG
jgi:hypothetical protein